MGKIQELLMELNESYEQTRRHILMFRRIPSVEEAFNIVEEDEIQHVVKPVLKSENVGFQATDSYHSQDSFHASNSIADQIEYVAAYKKK